MHHPGTDKPPTFEIRANIDHLALEIESLVSPQKNEALHTLEKSIATLKTASRCEGVVILGLRFMLLFRSSAIPVVTHITTTPCPMEGLALKTDATSAIKYSRTETASTDT